MNLPQAPILRTCSRCGREFESPSGVRQSRCGTCKIVRPGDNGHDKQATLGDLLSHREKQVVAMVSEGHLNKHIAYELHLTEGTIKEYINRIFRKVGVSNRTELAIHFLRQELTAAQAELQRRVA